MIREREEIEEIYKWNLEKLYGDEDKWISDIEYVDSLIEKIETYRGKIGESVENLLGAVEAELEINRKLENIYTYSKMKLDENTSNDKYQAMVDRGQVLSVKASEACSYIVPELMAMEEKRLEEFMKDKRLELYGHYLRDILRGKSHTLSEAEERMLASVGEISGTSYQLYSMMNDADLRFPEIEDSDGNMVEITHGNYIPFMESGDRRVRKDAFESLYKTYSGFKNTFATSLGSEVKKNRFYSKARKYGSSIEHALHGDNIPVAVYENLIEAVGNNVDKLHSYISLRKKSMKLEEIHMYDLYAPMVEDLDMKIEYEEAKRIVLEGLGALGEEYLEVVKEGLESRWIDVYENRGKRSGAYSWGTYDSEPYILLNYHDTLDNVFTLAHEMGHSVHSYYSKENQPYVYGGYSIFLAEIASTVNEVLLINHLIASTDDREKKKHFLNHYLEQFRGTVYRQTMFAEFEKIIHEKAESGEALTAETLSSLYSELNRKYYGEEIVLDPGIEVEWARIPHFYYNFYVYQYATGFSAAVYFAEKIISGDADAREMYIEFLKSGSSDYPTEILKKAGLDMTSSEPIEKALEKFGELVSEYEMLMEEKEKEA